MKDLARRERVSQYPCPACTQDGNKGTFSGLISGHITDIKKTVSTARNAIIGMLSSWAPVLRSILRVSRAGALMICTIDLFFCLIRHHYWCQIPEDAHGKFSFLAKAFSGQQMYQKWALIWCQKAAPDDGDDFGLVLHGKLLVFWVGFFKVQLRTIVIPEARSDRRYGTSRAWARHEHQHWDLHKTDCCQDWYQKLKWNHHFPEFIGYKAIVHVYWAQKWCQMSEPPSQKAFSMTRSAVRLPSYPLEQFCVLHLTISLSGNLAMIVDIVCGIRNRNCPLRATLHW